VINKLSNMNFNL